MKLEKSDFHSAYVGKNWRWSLVGMTLLAFFACGAPDSPRPLIPGVAGVQEKTEDQRSDPTSIETGATDSAPAAAAGGTPITMPYGLALWKVSCPLQTQPQSMEDRIGLVRFVGTGDYKLSRSRLDRTRLQVEGEWCVADSKRAIVLAIDVSKEMDYLCGLFGKRCGPDIKTNGTCARASFVKSISAWAVEKGHRLGFVTFSNEMKSASSGLTFKAEGMTEEALSDTFCDSGNSLDWSVPFTEGQSLLVGALPNETKELVVISSTDIAQNKLTEVTAQVEAMKGKGFNVSVALLNGADGTTTRATQFASPELGDKKFFQRLQDGLGLPTALGLVTRTQITVKEINLRPLGEAEWSTSKLAIDSTDQNFIFDTGFDVDGGIQAEGYEMELIQKDLRGRTNRMSSRIIFEN